MDMSFGIQAKGLWYLSKHGKEMDKKVYALPAEIDREVALIKLNSTGVNIDVLTPEQEEYLARVE
jgi:adenosylhomocysteinase